MERTMNDQTFALVDAVSEFVSELLAYRSAYGLDELGQLSSASEAEAAIRLRLRISDYFCERGWEPPREEHEAIERDRALLAEADDGDFLPEPNEAPAPRELRAPADVELQQMHRALESRAIIEQAKGIAMERYGLSAATAWSWLVRTSQQRNQKVRTLASEIVESVAAAQREQRDPRERSRGTQRCSTI
jgi:hypothetical protein